MGEDYFEDDVLGKVPAHETAISACDERQTDDRLRKVVGKLCDAFKAELFQSTIVLALVHMMQTQSSDLKNLVKRNWRDQRTLGAL